MKPATEEIQAALDAIIATFDDPFIARFDELLRGMALVREDLAQGLPGFGLSLTTTPFGTEGVLTVGGFPILSRKIVLQ